jgi:hypothetical protein
VAAVTLGSSMAYGGAVAHASSMAMEAVAPAARLLGHVEQEVWRRVTAGEDRRRMVRMPCVCRAVKVCFRIDT